MTTESDFQAALDADQTGYQTRLVFADFLQDRDDPRAEGYRALGVLRLSPWKEQNHRMRRFGLWSWSEAVTGKPFGCVLKSFWYSAMLEVIGHDAEARRYGVRALAVFDTRRLAEDAAALGFAKLSANRRAALFGQGVTA